MSGQVKYTVDDYRRVITKYKSLMAVWHSLNLVIEAEACAYEYARHTYTEPIRQAAMHQIRLKRLWQELAEVEITLRKVTERLIELMAYSLTGENRLMPPSVFLAIVTS